MKKNRVREQQPEWTAGKTGIYHYCHQATPMVGKCGVTVEPEETGLFIVESGMFGEAPEEACAECLELLEKEA